MGLEDFTTALDWQARHAEEGGAPGTAPARNAASCGSIPRLRQLPPVLAFASAPPRDGGTGAVLVLLRRQRETGTPDDHPDKRDARGPG